MKTVQICDSAHLIVHLSAAKSVLMKLRSKYSWDASNVTVELSEPADKPELFCPVNPPVSASLLRVFCPLSVARARSRSRVDCADPFYPVHVAEQPRPDRNVTHQSQQNELRKKGLIQLLFLHLAFSPPPETFPS